MDSPPPFSKVDKLKFTFKGFDLTSVFKPDGWRKYFLFGVIASGIMWILLGYESCFDQLEIGSQYLLGYFLQQNTWNDFLQMTQYRYGIATHFSALVIYGIMFYAISKYYDNIDIGGSLNLFMSFSLTTLAVSLYEFSWMASYYWSQQQFWVLTPLTRQASILYQNLFFLTAGISLLLFVSACPHLRFRRNKKFYFLLGLSASLWLLWFYYPLPTKQLAVTFESGEIQTYPKQVNIMGLSLSNFPQTLYTIDRNPTDADAVGEPFFVEDHYVHTINLLTKIVWTYTIFYFGKVLPKGEFKHEKI